jgi:radical SAM-linked protein
VIENGSEPAAHPAEPPDQNTPDPYPEPAIKKQDPPVERIVFTFSKRDRGVFLPHLCVIEVFSMAMMRAGIPVLFSQGFNPLPVIDFASPVSLGITCDAEIATVDMSFFMSARDFMEAIASRLPDGIAVTGALNIRIPPGAKKYSAA